MNYLNVFAAILGFTVGIGMLFGLWTPINDFIEVLPTGLQLFSQLAFVLVCFLVMFFVPVSLAVSDDKGTA